MHSASDDNEPAYEKRQRRKKCPICWDSVYMTDVRPVRWYEGQEQAPPREGGDIVLRLVVRGSGSTLALPKESANNILLKGEDIPWHFAADVMDFSRVMKGTGDYMVSQFESEIEAISQLERHDELMFGADDEWTARATRSVTEARDRARAIGAPVHPHHKREAAAPGEKEASTSPTASALSTSLAAFRNAQSAPPAHTPSDYYFYHALLHYYLSPLDIRILKAAFGDYSAFPSTILPRVERVSTGHVVDDELRRRTKYLAHLPHGCEVAFLECDWTDTVPAEVLEHFKADIDKRRKRNADKDAREERDRVRAERQEDEKRWAAARRKRPSQFDSDVDAISKFGPDDFAPLAGGASPPPAESLSPSWGPQSSQRTGFHSLASPSTSPNDGRTVWGTAAVVPQSPPLPALESQGPPVDDGWLQGWEKDLLDEETEMLAEMGGVSLNGDAPNSSGGGGGKKGKKKGKKITLMSTNARRGA